MKVPLFFVLNCSPGLYEPSLLQSFKRSHIYTQTSVSTGSKRMDLKNTVCEYLRGNWELLNITDILRSSFRNCNLFPYHLQGTKRFKYHRDSFQCLGDVCRLYIKSI